MKFPAIEQVVFVARTAQERAALVGTVTASALIFYVPLLAFQRYDDAVGDWVNFGAPSGWARGLAASGDVVLDDSYANTILRVDSEEEERHITLHTPGWIGFTFAVKKLNALGEQTIIETEGGATIDGATSISIEYDGMRGLTWVGGGLWTVTTYVPGVPPI